MGRVVSNDSSGEAIIKLADNHAGAATVMVALMKDGADIDPDNALGIAHKIRLLDNCGIYGERIWQFYRGLCKKNLCTMCALLRAVELGQIDCRELNRAISLAGHWDDDDVYDCVTHVMETLPHFRRSLSDGAHG